LTRELDHEPEIFVRTLDIAARGRDPRAVAVRRGEVKPIAVRMTALEHQRELALRLIELAELREDRTEQQRGDRLGLEAIEPARLGEHGAELARGVAVALLAERRARVAEIEIELEAAVALPAQSRACRRHDRLGALEVLAEVEHDALLDHRLDL